MVRIPGASHGIANRPNNLIAKLASILASFESIKIRSNQLLKESMGETNVSSPIEKS